MKKNRLFFLFITVQLFLFLFSITAYANSSWHWISSTRPYDLLPIVVVITLIIEVASINYFSNIRRLRIVIPVVALANLVSFLFPYLWISVDPFNVYSYSNFPDTENGFFGVIKQSIESYPTFTVSFLYLLITLLLETPIVYLLLRKKAQNNKNLIKVIIIANTVTTVLTFAIERIFCRGEW